LAFQQNLWSDPGKRLPGDKRCHEQPRIKGLTDPTDRSWWRPDVSVTRAIRAAASPRRSRSS